MRFVHVNGVRYACPFEKSLPPHTAAALAGLGADIRRTGRVLLPVIVFTSPTHGRCVLDGVTRARRAEELGLPDVPVDDWGEVPDGYALDRCLALNTHRRQLAPKDHEEVVLAMRRAGETVTGIAAAAGIPRGRVVRILEDAGAPAPPPHPQLFDDEPDDEPDEDDDEEEDDEEDDGDEVPTPGCAMPAGLREDAARDAVSRALKALATLRNATADVLESAAGELLRKAARNHGHAVPPGAPGWPVLDEIGAAYRAVAAALG